jgi:hypothetical protein
MHNRLESNIINLLTSLILSNYPIVIDVLMTGIVESSVVADVMRRLSMAPPMSSPGQSRQSSHVTVITEEEDAGQRAVSMFKLAAKVEIEKIREAKKLEAVGEGGEGEDEEEGVLRSNLPPPPTATVTAATAIATVTAATATAAACDEQDRNGQAEAQKGRGSNVGDDHLLFVDDDEDRDSATSDEAFQKDRCGSL